MRPFAKPIVIAAFCIVIAVLAAFSLAPNFLP
jgi:hypothetical protein